MPMLVKGVDLSFLKTKDKKPGGKVRLDAIRRAMQRVREGATLPIYDSLDEAESAAKARTFEQKSEAYR